VPVLTCLGSTFPGRVASSLLHAIGLPELIAPSLTEYETLAIDLAQNPHKLSTIRLKLQENSKNFPLFNSNLYTQNLEAAYKKMYEIYSSDMPPESFCV
jgi:predicted O-linked N-acetylglucosamine transferase (SPINDLY family)